MWSATSVQSRWVRAEATLAERNKTLMPVMIERCDRPIMFELMHTADLSHWNGDPDDVVWQTYLAGLRLLVQAGGRTPDSVAENRQPVSRDRNSATAVSSAQHHGLTLLEIWHPIFAGLRTEERFKALVVDVGLYDYWRKSGNWGDFARPAAPDDFEIIG